MYLQVRPIDDRRLSRSRSSIFTAREVMLMNYITLSDLIQIGIFLATFTVMIFSIIFYKFFEKEITAHSVQTQAVILPNLLWERPSIGPLLYLYYTRCFIFVKRFIPTTHEAVSFFLPLTSCNHETRFYIMSLCKG